MKDYYKILRVTKSSTDDEIRKNYRKLAMQYHPDRNPDDTQAEEKFKEVAEAYGVLTDEVKRREYDRLRVNGRSAFPGTGNSEGFSYSQEDILRDLFKDPRFQHMFKGLLHEFQRSGFRANSTFIKNSFFHGKKGIFLGGVFLFGSLAKPVLTKVARKGLSGNSSLLKSVTGTVGSLLGFGQRNKNQSQMNSPRPKQIKEFDTTYHTPLSDDEFKHGKIIQVVVYGDEGEQTLKVTIPPASREGQRLRIKGKGRSGPLGRGDLYLNLVKQ